MLPDSYLGRCFEDTVNNAECFKTRGSANDVRMIYDEHADTREYYGGYYLVFEME